MNLTDNGVEKILNIERVIKEDEMYFLVTLIDYYGKEQTKRFNDIKNIEKRHWVE